MINISSIKLNMYCPMKLYIQTHVDSEEKEDFQIAIEIKNLKIDLQDLIHKNMRKIKKEMPISMIENILSENINSYIENTTKSLNLNLSEDKIDEIYKTTSFNIKITALKVKQAMILLDRDANAIVDMFFPNCMYSYLLKDSRIELIGMCDKIEIIDGKYYPISTKSTIPPLKGVWNADAIELVANAILIEEEFDTEVFVGFVHYTALDEKRPVIMDVNLRKGLFEVINEVKEIINNKKYPKVKTSEKKCGNCEYKTICLKD
ncbi:PD-(D/E)XK nuclease superfamily protein [Methanobrevibacter oralis]|uniref:CRISPR-associated exonuclease Cas4 n=1 Tax=Methanobrevibacter oralis TaxID=66851 RepID=A0A166BGN3_METOA|nr:CRISPR-associated protein Cas4 [Methanobrevibacter oralis]KZX13321.1 PD-(D/E)XK nuclease superfamily protein [Methanobrevibacter oralis]